MYDYGLDHRDLGEQFFVLTPPTKPDTTVLFHMAFYKEPPILRPS